MRLPTRLLIVCLALLSITSVAAAAAKPDKDLPPGLDKQGDTSPGQAGERGTTPAPGQVTEPGTPAAPTAGGLALTEPGPAEDPSLTQLGETVGMAPAGGKVKVRLPGEHEWTTLTDDAPLPLGSAVDARDGLVEIASEATTGTEQHAVVTGAIVRVEQDVLDQGATELVIGGGDFSHCDDTETAAATKAEAAARKRTKSGVVRGLWAAGKGRFRTRGRYAVAAVRGTRWATVDRCASTTVKVFDGLVAVKDLLAGTTVAVEAGEKHVVRTAAAHRR